MHRIAAIAAGAVLSLVACVLLPVLLPSGPVAAAPAPAMGAGIAGGLVHAAPALAPHRCPATATSRDASSAASAGTDSTIDGDTDSATGSGAASTTDGGPNPPTGPDADQATSPETSRETGPAIGSATSPAANSAAASAGGAVDRLYDPGRLAPIATGAGIRVAVIDSGVDATDPRLRGRVLPGRDLLHGNADGRQDCVGHGTAVAGIIAGRPGSGMRGLAPGVRIVPVRVSEQEQIGGRVEGTQGGAAAFARAIAWAADPHGGNAQVINLSVVTTVDDPRVRRAVTDAIAAGVVLVAAAGNNADDTGTGPDGDTRPGGENQGHGTVDQNPAGATPSDPPSYPAAYPGVIGVGAVGGDGVRAPYSQRGDYVDLVAVGDGVAAPVPGGGLAVVRGTSFAAPFVSATAALVLQRFPGSTPDGVRRRLVATSDPAPGGRADYGYGLLNPYRALTETLAPDRPAANPDASTPAPRTNAGEPSRAGARHAALTVAGAGGVAVALAGLLAVVARDGRRRGWRPPGSARA